MRVPPPEAGVNRGTEASEASKGTLATTGVGWDAGTVAPAQVHKEDRRGERKE